MAVETDAIMEDAAASEAYLTYFRLDAQNTPADVLEAMKLTLAKGLKAAFDASAETANEITEARAVCNFVVDATGDSVNDIKPEKIMGIITTNVDKGDTESLQHVLWRGIYETVRR